MTDKDWPFEPKSLTSSIPFDDAPDRLSLLIAGCSERLGRAITVIEKNEDVDGGMSRIDPINPRQNCAEICELLRNSKAIDLMCRRQDEGVARGIFKAISEGKKPSSAFPCHAGLVDYGLPIHIAGSVVAVALSGQFVKPNTTLVKLQAHPEQVNLHEVKNALSNSISEREYKKKLPGKSYLSRFQDVVESIQRYVETEWRNTKRIEEMSLIRHLVRKMGSIQTKKNRTRFSLDALELLRTVARFLSVDNIAIFVTDPELISAKVDKSILRFFCESATDSRGDARLTISSKHILNNQATDVPGVYLCTDIHQDVFYQNGWTYIMPVKLSSKFSCAFLFGKFKSAKLSKEDLVFLSEVSNYLGIWLLSNLDAIDSEQMSETWSDTFDWLVHDVRRALHPVSHSVFIFKSVLRDEGAFGKRDAEEALARLDYVYKHFSRQVKRPVESYAANVEKIYEFEHADLFELVAENVQISYASADSKSVLIAVDPSIKGNIFVDPVRFGTALGHILDNAIKYASHDTSVLIACCRTKTHVILEIQNVGLSIPKNEVELVFRKGFRSMAAVKQNEDGMGLGLFHANMVLKAHGGTITFSSKPHSGDENLNERFQTSFWLHVPNRRRK